MSPTHQRVRRWLEWVVLVTTALINAVTAVDLLVDILVSIGPL